MKTSHSFFSGCLLLVSLLGLLSCNSSSLLTDNGPGSVAILLTDDPATDFDEINVTITEIKLISDHHQVSIFQGLETINLLELASHSNLFAFVDNVPSGHYHKIRLIFDEVTLVRYQGQGSDAFFTDEIDDEIIHPKNKRHNKIDLNPRGTFEVIAGETLYIQLDVDANKSIKITETGNGDFIFRPVIFVEVLNDGLTGKLVRVSGTVMDKNDIDQTFDLCNTSAKFSHHEHDSDDYDSHHDEHQQCIEVMNSLTTSYFSADGQAASFEQIENNQQVTLLGYFRASYYHDSHDNYHDDGDHDGYDDDYDHHMILDAEIVELAATNVYWRFKGQINSSLSLEQSFELLLDTGQSIVVDSTILVELIDGAKVYTYDGKPLTYDDIVLHADIIIEGVLVLSGTDADKIKAAVIFIDQTSNIVKLSGSVIDAYPTQNYFDMTDQNLGDRCVSIGARTGIYAISIIDSSINTMPIGLVDFENGQSVDAYGHWDNGCLLANDVLISAN